MKINYKPKYFQTYELVPEWVYNTYGESSLRFLDNRILKMADLLREKFGKATCNDWFWGGNYDSRGFRPPNDPDGAKLSAHKRGQALDLIFTASAEKIRQYIIDNPDEFEYITLIEADVNWVHISCENVEKLTIIKV